MVVHLVVFLGSKFTPSGVELAAFLGQNLIVKEIL